MPQVQRMRSEEPQEHPEETPCVDHEPDDGTTGEQQQEKEQWTAEQHLYYERRKGETPVGRRRRLQNKVWLLVTLFNNPELKQLRRHDFAHELARLQFHQACVNQEEDKAVNIPSTVMTRSHAQSRIETD